MTNDFLKKSKIKGTRSGTNSEPEASNSISSRFRVAHHGPAHPLVRRPRILCRGVAREILLGSGMEHDLGASTCARPPVPGPRHLAPPRKRATG